MRGGFFGGDLGEGVVDELLGGVVHGHGAVGFGEFEGFFGCVHVVAGEFAEEGGGFEEGGDFGRPEGRFLVSCFWFRVELIWDLGFGIWDSAGSCAVTSRGEGEFLGVDVDFVLEGFLAGGFAAVMDGDAFVFDVFFVVEPVLAVFVGDDAEHG